MPPKKPENAPPVSDAKNKRNQGEHIPFKNLAMPQDGKQHGGEKPANQKPVKDAGEDVIGAIAGGALFAGALFGPVGAVAGGIIAGCVGSIIVRNRHG